MANVTRTIEVRITGKDDGASSTIGSVGGAISNLGKVGVGIAAGGLVAVAGGLGAVGKAATTSALDFEKATDALVVGTGATGSALSEMEGSVKRLAGSSAGLGTDMGQIGAVMAEVNTRTGATGETLEDFTKGILDMSRLTGGDAVKNTQLITRVMGDWGVEMKDSGQLLDMIFGAGQSFGVGVDALSSKVVQFGAPMRQMGFSLEESVALFGKWEKEGVNAELAIGSLRIAAGKFARENTPLQQGLEDTMKAIKGASSESEGLALAMDVFGARAGPDMAAAIREGRFDLEDAIKTLQGTEGGLDDAANRTIHFGEMWEMIQKKVMISLIPIGEAILKLASSIMPEIERAFEKLKPAIDFVAGAVSDFFGAFARTADLSSDLGPIDGILMGITGALKTIIPPELMANIIEFTDALGWLSNTIIKSFIGEAKNGGNTIKNILGGAFRFVAEKVLPILTKAVQFVNEHWDAFKGAIMGVAAVLTGAGIVTIIAAIGSALAALISPIGAVIAAAALLGAAWAEDWGGIRTMIMDAWENTIKPALVDLWEWLSINVPIAITTVTDFFNNTLLPIFTAVFGQIQETGSSVLSSLTQWWSEHGDNVMTIVKTFMEVVWATISYVLTSIQQFWDKWGDTIIAVTKVAWDLIYGYVKTAMTLIGAVIDAISAIIEGDWTKFGEALKTIWKALWEWQQTLLKAALDLLMIAINAFIVLIQEWWDGFKESLINRWNELWETVQSIFDVSQSLLISAIATLIQSIVSLWSTFVETVKTAWRTMWQNVAQAIDDTKQSILDKINEIIEKIKDMFTVDKFKELGQRIADGIKSGIESAKGAISDKVNDIINNIKSLFSPDTFKAAGAQVLAGIVQGMTEGLDMLADIAQALVDKLIDEVKKALGISSPSSIFAGIGKNITAGLAIGISDTSALPVNALQNAASQMISNTYNFTQNIYGGSPSAGREFQMMRAEAAAFGS